MHNLFIQCHKYFFIKMSPKLLTSRLARSTASALEALEPLATRSFHRNRRRCGWNKDSRLTATVGASNLLGLHPLGRPAVLASNSGKPSNRSAHSAGPGFSSNKYSNEQRSQVMSICVRFCLVVQVDLDACEHKCRSGQSLRRHYSGVAANALSQNGLILDRGPRVEINLGKRKKLNLRSTLWVRARWSSVQVDLHEGFSICSGLLRVFFFFSSSTLPERILGSCPLVSCVSWLTNRIYKILQDTSLFFLHS